MILWLLAALASQNQATDKYMSLSTVTGGQIAEECSVDQGLKLDVCTSYILGVADAFQLSRVTCRPQSDAATLQTVTIARRYIAAHPEKWGMHPAMLVREALVATFPCPQ